MNTVKGSTRKAIRVDSDDTESKEPVSVDRLFAAMSAKDVPQGVCLGIPLNKAQHY